MKGRGDTRPKLTSVDGLTELPVTTDLRAKELPYETEQLRAELAKFLDQPYQFGRQRFRRLGAVKWGVYAFFDYDHEPIYVGQTKESLGTRIRRHLTNQRSDAVAMSVLDPLEVHTVAVWPLPEFQKKSTKDPKATRHLNSLEHTVYKRLLRRSKFKRVLNEKLPLPATIKVEVPASIEARIVTDTVILLRDHPDLRIARRALTIAKLAQVISERKVQRGLRGTLVAQAARLYALAEQRFRLAADVSDREAD